MDAYKKIITDLKCAEDNVVNAMTTCNEKQGAGMTAYEQWVLTDLRARIDSVVGVFERGRENSM